MSAPSTEASNYAIEILGELVDRIQHARGEIDVLIRFKGDDPTALDRLLAKRSGIDLGLSHATDALRLGIGHAKAAAGD